jgi:hypothetical protein
MNVCGAGVNILNNLESTGRSWPKADPNFTQFLPIRTAAFGKSGHSGVGRSKINLERPLYPCDLNRSTQHLR